MLFPQSAFDDAEGTYLSVRGHRPFALSLAASQAARRLARREHCSLFATVLAALKLVLSTHAGCVDVRAGTLASNRHLSGTQHIVGLFTNVVCLRTHVDRTLRFGDLMRAVHATIGEAMQAQDLPFEIVAQTLAAEEGLGHRLFQLLVLWQAMPTGARRIPGIETAVYRPGEEPLTVVYARNPTELKVELVETPTAIYGSTTYQMTRFTIADIDGLIESLDGVLQQAEADPDGSVATLADRACHSPTATGSAATS
jgi:non-ribosomal peptide synthetase component F